MVDHGGLIALVTLGFYLWIAPAHVIYGDNAEFSALGALGGAAHPSGYPLYVLWLRAWSWLPAESPAHAAAMATAILTALQVLVLHAACRAWGARPLAATFAVVLFATGPIVMRVQSEAEVFALNGLICATVLWLAASAGPLRGRRRVFALALVAGLGLSNHVTCVLIAPIGLLGAVRGVREAGGARAASACLGIAGLVLGLLPYAYLLITPETWISWGKLDSLAGVLRHFLREDYGGPGQFSPRGGDVPITESVVAWLHSLGRAYLWVPAALGAGALGYFAARGDRTESRVAWSLLLASFVIAGPLLVMRFNVKPSHLGLYVVQRFHLLSIALLAVPVAVAVDRLVTRLAAAGSAPSRLAGSVIAQSLLTVAGFVTLAAPSLGYVARMHSPAIELGLENMLRTLPPDAIVIGAPDEFHFGLGYLQGALGERRDVAVITVSQLGLPFYRERVRARTGIVVENVPRGSNVKLSVRLAEQALATGRPVFIDPLQANIAMSLPTYPYGLLFRVLPRGATLPSIEEVFAINKQLYAQYRFGYELPGEDDQLATQFHVQYARTWRILAEALAHARRGEDAAFATEMAVALEPRSGR